jgi:phosphatidylglycerol:prolipoprotein diacylglycerol transferase
MTTHYIHHLNPIVLPLWGNLAIRWYGLSYLASFLVCILFLRSWSHKKEFQIPEKEVSNFVVLLAFFGVFLGGRLGYVLFYGFDTFLKDPVSLFKVWEGGMSSHGGFIGTILFMTWYAHKHGHSFWNLADNLACTTSIGFTFGRLANFINGELWGRITDVKWGVIFPQTLGPGFERYSSSDIQAFIADGTLQPRHPSQLYQAFAEGLLVFGIMLLLRKTTWAKRPGNLSAAYLILYAGARIAMEFFREPDDGQFFIGWISKGQFYSMLMAIAAFTILLRKHLPGKTKAPSELR